MIVALYDGVIGSVPVTATRTRSGSFGTLAGTTTTQAVQDAPKWEWQGLLSTKRRGDRPKKVQTVTYKDHRVVPFNGASGQRVIDVTWKVTFKRLEAIH